MRYTGDFGCKFRWVPHDLKISRENSYYKAEVCQICNKKFRWNKGYKSRMDNKRYLEAHIRNFCQKFGATKRIYYKIYQPENSVIKL